jgi:hypothetical protein
VLMSGVQEFDTDTSKATQTGFKIHHALGNFTQDLLFLNERVLPPTFDWSLAYVAKYRAFGALDIGGGVNFYRLIPYSAVLETPGHMGSANAPQNSYQEVAPGDTVFYTHQGIKLMGMFSLDLNALLNVEKGADGGFKVYGEAAVLGVKDYGGYYDDVLKRIPAMVGFTLPLGILGELSTEVEWYGSRYRNDLALIGYPRSVVAPWQDPGFGTPSPGPVQPGAYADSTADNVKWALFLRKTMARHIQFIAQVANDHYRPGQLPTAFVNAVGGTQAVLTSPRDWYFMGRLGFFF